MPRGPPRATPWDNGQAAAPFSPCIHHLFVPAFAAWAQIARETENGSAPGKHEQEERGFSDGKMLLIAKATQSHSRQKQRHESIEADHGLSKCRSQF